MTKKLSLKANLLAMLVLSTGLSGLAHAGEPPLPTDPAVTRSLEAQDALPRTAFYSTPADIAASAPGALLRQEKAPEYSLPKGFTATRILYRSTDSHGKPVATSGVVVVPPGKAPEGGWPVIVWAHGTSGTAQSCAPSLMKDVYYGGLRVFDLASAGFVLVMTDYHGLGTDSPHQYMNKFAQVADIRNAVPAAHALMPDLSQKWFVVGHSQGAYAALATAEAEAKDNDPGYLGAISIAPAARVGMINANISAVKKAGGPYMSWLAYAIHAQYPEFKPEELLSKAGLSQYPEATGKACWLTGNALYYPYSAKELVRPDWDKNKYVKKFFAEQTVGYEKAKGPILLIAGGGDTTIPIHTLESYAKDACHAGSDVKYMVVPNAEHGAAMVESMDTQIAWLKSVLAGNAPSNTCQRH